MSFSYLKICLILSLISLGMIFSVYAQDHPWPYPAYKLELYYKSVKLPQINNPNTFYYPIYSLKDWLQIFKDEKPIDFTTHQVIYFQGTDVLANAHVQRMELLVWLDPKGVPWKKKIQVVLDRGSIITESALGNPPICKVAYRVPVSPKECVEYRFVNIDCNEIRVPKCNPWLRPEEFSDLNSRRCYFDCCMETTNNYSRNHCF